MILVQNSKILGAWLVCSILITSFAGCTKTADTVPAKPDSDLGAAAEIPGIEITDGKPEMSDTQEVVFRSGMEIGAFPPAFEVVDVTGPNKGKQLCYRCLYGGRPVVGIIVRELDENAENLIKKIDQEVTSHQDEKMAAFVVMLTDDPESANPILQKIAVENKIKNIPLTIFQGTDGPLGYHITKEAFVNVMMWKGDVKANRAYQKNQLNDQEIQEVIADARLLVH